MKLVILKYKIAILILILVPTSMSYVNAQITHDENELTLEINPLANTGDFIDTLKQDENYFDMNITEQDVYITKNNDFMNPPKEYEFGRNNLLIKLSLTTLELKIVSDADIKIKLEEKYNKILKELEEYGVGPEDKTSEDPGYYFDKYDQKIKEIESTSQFNNIYTEDVSLSTQLGYYFLIFQVHLTYLLVILLGFFIMVLELLV